MMLQGEEEALAGERPRERCGGGQERWRSEEQQCRVCPEVNENGRDLQPGAKPGGSTSPVHTHPPTARQDPEPKPPSPTPLPTSSPA